MKKRWYEMSADACILISMIELSKSADRERYAKQLITELTDLGYEPDPDLYDECLAKYSMQRWYDANKEVFLAIEYLKDAEKEIQSTAITRVKNYMSLEAVS